MGRTDINNLSPNLRDLVFTDQIQILRTTLLPSGLISQDFGPLWWWGGMDFAAMSSNTQRKYQLLK